MHLLKSNSWGLGKWQRICVYFCMSASIEQQVKESFSLFLISYLCCLAFFTSIWKYNILEGWISLFFLVPNIFFTLKLFLELSFQIKSSLDFSVQFCSWTENLVVYNFTFTLTFVFHQRLGLKTVFLCFRPVFLVRFVGTWLVSLKLWSLLWDSLILKFTFTKLAKLQFGC